MKRSKMEQILQTHLENIPLEDLPQDADYHARLILSIIESQGMLPPKIKNPEFKGGNHITLYPYYANEWEPENDS